jgi:class 3 adenylate cyclase
MMALFNAPARQPDHPVRAARAALAIQRRIADVAEPGWPRFRIGVNTGPALLGNLGSSEIRSFSVVGDAVNTASRLETSAEVGTVVIGDATYAAIADRVEVTELGPLELKGKSQPIVAYLLEGILESALS